MKKFILTQSEYVELCGIISVALRAAESDLLKEEIKAFYKRIEDVAAECNDDEFRAGQVDIINKFKDILEIE